MKIGVLGAGQLGQMLALAGRSLGVELRFFSPEAGAPASGLAEQVVAEYENRSALEHFAEGLDVVTYEFESVPVASVEYLAERVAVFPPARALETAQDRLYEKQFFRKLGIPTPDFAAVGFITELRDALGKVGAPAVLKTRRLGYDGKGQFVIRNSSEIETAWVHVGGVPLILEKFVDFARELSIIAVRSAAGECRFYPLVENHHSEGILRLSVAPAPSVSEELQSRAEGYARLVMNELEYVGVLAIELFQRGDELIVNEMAPRVHNSGHWTIEGAATSQFENHLRAITGMPLGNTEPTGAAGMLNVIGTVPDFTRIQHHADAYVHMYGKKPAPKRKLGHVTVLAEDMQGVRNSVAELRRLLSKGGM